MMMDDAILDMQLKRLVTFESVWARRLIDTSERARKLRELRRLFCLPEFKTDNLYWEIFIVENRN
jgi:hypothetical protein